MKHVGFSGVCVILVGFCLFIVVQGASPFERNLDDPSCHPTPKSLSNVYIVGYGSLLNTASKGKTYPDTGPNIPVNVNGFARKWNCKGSPVGLSTTFLGVDADPSGFFNGVVFKLPNLESLKEFDKREIYYCRQEVFSKDLHFLVDNNTSIEGNSSSLLELPDETSQYWIYTVKPEFISFPSTKYPIVQSYVDIFLGGCIEMEKTYGLKDFNYTDNCMLTTEGWNYPWVNDRLLPRRPAANTPRAYAIDTLIEKIRPGHFDNIAIEHEIRFNAKNNAAIQNRWNNLSINLIGLILVALNLN